MPSAIWSPDYACDIGPHVFPVVKYRLVRDALIAEGTLDPADVALPPSPSREDLERVHTAAYLDDLEQLRWSPRTLYSELPLTPEIVNAYVLACGGTVAAAREALEHGAAVHLGGGFHHAFADKAEGFCYLNDLAVGARVLQAEGGARRVAIVDLDVHQGNGTAGIFARDDSVFTLSVHQENNYPVPKPPSDLDVGLADRTGDDEYLAALRPALERVWSFGPQLVLYQAGADPYRDDQLGGLALGFEGLERRDREVLEGCAQRGIAVVVTLGGGYARQLQDTLRIHATTGRIALSLRR
jgi:acetoin utilization deacetylase AcuC-like enzyme